ncbi:MAG: dihydropyrimidinase [Eubacteriales bacterium]|nr:dihydropyrimidinase [Eubacteriales bacterium]
MKIGIRGGNVVSSDGVMKTDIIIDGEKIAKIGENLCANEEEIDEIIDAKDTYVMPGLIDAHTHFDLFVAGTDTCDDFYSGTRAAVAGGTTSIIDFANHYRGENLHEVKANWDKRAEKGCSCDYSYHMSIADWNEEISKECQDMMDEGITTFKCYMTYPDNMLDDETLFKVLKRLKEIGGITGVHCENAGMIDALREEYSKDERLGKISSHYLTRPAAAEAEAINRLLHLAEVADTPVIDVHLSCEEGLEEIRAARSRGQKVYVETCPHYLCLDNSVLDTDDFEGAKYICSPPLRTKHDNDVLWDAIRDGEIQTISTDHCSFTWEQRLMGKGDFKKIPGGLAGVELRGPLMYSEGVDKGRISIEKMCEVCSTNPAKLYGMYPQKGIIAEGSDADIIIINPNKKQVLSAETQVSRCDYSNYEGKEITGVIEKVFLRGQLVAEEGRVVKENQGKFIKRGKYSL